MDDDLSAVELVVLLLFAVLAAGAIVMENVDWGVAQGCRFVFAGIGLGCT